MCAVSRRIGVVRGHEELSQQSGMGEQDKLAFNEHAKQREAMTPTGPRLAATRQWSACAHSTHKVFL